MHSGLLYATKNISVLIIFQDDPYCSRELFRLALCSIFAYKAIFFFQINILTSGIYSDWSDEVVVPATIYEPTVFYFDHSDCGMGFFWHGEHIIKGCTKRVHC